MLSLFDGFCRATDGESSSRGSFGRPLNLDVGVGGLFDEVEVVIVLTDYC